MSLELISEIYVAPEMTKSIKYKRFNNEKRVKRTPGEKRTQTQKITTTKWEPEIANNKASKIGRKRDRDYKYGKWNDGRTDSCSEDKNNDNSNKAMRERLRVAALERRGIYQRKNLDLKDVLFPVYHLKDKDSWPTSAWESYYEMKDVEEVRCDEGTHVLVTPEKIVGFSDLPEFKWEQDMPAKEWVKNFWSRAAAMTL